eukprot:UN03448
MGKGKKAKNKTDDNWEDDLAEIAKESGIDFNKENDTEEFIANIPKKKRRRKENTKRKIWTRLKSQQNQLNQHQRGMKKSKPRSVY